MTVLPQWHRPEHVQLLNRTDDALVCPSAYPQLSDQQHREWALLDTHDESLGVVSVWAARGGNGVEARGRRPA